MKISKIIVFIFIVTLVSCSTTSTEEENELYSMDLKIDISENETALLELVNEYRASKGLRELIMDATIYPCAIEHNLFMIEDDSISHSNFALRSDNVKKTTPAKNVSENVARFFNTNQQVLQGWLNSPSHKATLEGNHTHTVISITRDSEGQKYFTQLFYN